MRAALHFARLPSWSVSRVRPHDVPNPLQTNTDQKPQSFSGSPVSCTRIRAQGGGGFPAGLDTSRACSSVLPVPPPPSLLQTHHTLGKGLRPRLAGDLGLLRARRRNGPVGGESVSSSLSSSSKSDSSCDGQKKRRAKSDISHAAGTIQPIKTSQRPPPRHMATQDQGLANQLPVPLTWMHTKSRKQQRSSRGERR